MEFCEIELTTYLRVYSIFQKNRSDTVEVKPGDIQAELSRASLQVATFVIAAPGDKTQGPGQKTRGTRGALSSGEVLKYEKVSVTTSRGARSGCLGTESSQGWSAGTFGLGVPTYYRQYYDGCYPGYQCYTTRIGNIGITTTITTVIGIVGSTVELTRVKSHSRGGDFSGEIGTRPSPYSGFYYCCQTTG